MAANPIACTTQKLHNYRDLFLELQQNGVEEVLSIRKVLAR